MRAAPPLSLAPQATAATTREPTGTSAMTLSVDPIALRGDRIIRVYLLGHLAISLALAPFYGTWAMALGAGCIITLMFWVSSLLLPGTFPTRVVAGVALQAFCALHIYQMHGMAEMHFFFFTSATAMLVYQDWRAIWPGVWIIILQHIAFAVLHNSGVQLSFFEASRVGVLKLTVHFGIALAHAVLTSWWAHMLRQRTRENAIHNKEMRTAADKLESELDRSRSLVKELNDARDRLVQAEKLAAAGQLAAGVGHEINNPLAFVSGNLRFLRGWLDEQQAPLTDREEAAQCLAEAEEGSKRIAAIVRDLKSFARPDESQLGAVDVVRAIEFALSMAAPELRHRAKVERHFEKVPLVHGNEARLGQVLLCLLVNAAQAIPEGQVAQNLVRVSVRRQGDKVVVEVLDTGCGMKPEVLARIFEPFFTTKPVGQGTGLGLSIAHRVVTALGGSLTASSMVNMGSIFKLVLNVCSDAQATGPSESDAEPLRDARVLVVDDEPNMASLVARLLGKDVQVVAALSGRAALDLLAKDQRFDVILCDMMMPDLTGPDVHREVQQKHPALLSRLVMMTGGAFTDRSRAFLDALDYEPLAKPFDPVQLRAVVVQKTLARAGHMSSQGVPNFSPS